MLSFSQRKGLKPIRTIIQIDSADDALRNQLWNCLTTCYWKYVNSSYYAREPVYDLLKVIWSDYYELRMDEMPRHPLDMIAKIKEDFLKGTWDDMYTILEFVLENSKGANSNIYFVELVNSVLEKYLSAYRFVDNIIVDITSEVEVKSIEEALRDSSIHKPAQEHLKRALELMSDRQNPDYRNSIKESISAVEALCSAITGKPKATLGQALAEIEKSHQLHSALKESFSKLYGWTSDASGIRHKLLEESTLSQEDARFMLITCSAFINYLLVKADT